MSDETTVLLPARRQMSLFNAWKIGAAFVAAGMATGAFGAHGLRKRSGITADSLNAWNTASHYTIFNGLGLMAVSLHPRLSAHRFAIPAIAIGGAIFSSTIWALVLDRDRFKVLGPVTPMGGFFMILGYISLAFA